MAISNPFNYKTESNRYRYYYRRLQVFYEKPITQVSTAVLFTLFTIIFFAIFAIRPTLVTISELLRKIEDQQKVLVKAEKKSASLAAAQQLYSQISGDIGVIDSAIPPDYQIQQLLLSLESSAAELNIPINNLRVSEVTYPQEKLTERSIKELNFTISFNATYPDAKILITRLNQLPRLVSFDSITLGQPKLSRRTQTTNNQAIEINLNCRTFYYPEKN